MEEEFDEIRLQDEESLLDLSSENDALILDISSPLSASSSGLSHHQQSSEHKKEPKNFDILGPSSTGKEPGMTPSGDQDDQLPYLTESSEPEGVEKTRKCNLRKSLAWDSAFFTSAGVLDPEELSSMIKGADKNERKTLPGIEEDVRRSNDSISTLESDNLTLENLEVELFEDIRASIQKSSKMFNMTSISSKAASGKCQPNSSLKKMSVASHDQLKARYGLKKPSGALKSQMNQTLNVQGPARAVKQDSVHAQVAQPMVKTGTSISTIAKPPRTISKGRAIFAAAAKRSSMGAAQENKTRNDKTGIVAGKGVQASRVPLTNGARRVLSKPAASLKSSSLGSSKSTKTESARSSLSDSSGSVSSESTVKSLLATARRKVVDGTLNPSSSSTHKTPLKAALRNRTTGNPALSTYVVSSSISPASSVSEWSSASSTSSSTINQRCNKSRTSLDTSSCRSLDNEVLPSDLGDQLNSQGSDAQENGRVALRDESSRKSSTGTSTLPKPGSMKPSGLRMPSPKIGFFDGVKSVRTPNGTMQSHGSVPTASPKCRDVARSPHKSSSTKGKIGKLPQSRTASASANRKPSANKPSSPVISEEKLNASFHVSSDKENGTSGKQVNEFEKKSGHGDPNTCNFESGHLDENLELGSIPSTFNCTSRNPLVAMNSIPVGDSLDQRQRTDFAEN